MALVNKATTNYHNMYNEVSGNTNLRNLANLQDINSISEAANGILASVDDETKRERIIEFFYDKLLVDTLKLGSENNVFVKYCKVKTIPQGNEKFLLRRWGGLTEHTTPLAEGIPPTSDRMASESFTGTYCSYGRYMEFTDRVDYMLIDPVIAHYTIELGDTAVRMAERLCRQELEANAAVVYPDGKTFETLIVGDTVGIEDYRLQALKFHRILVKPLSGGKYNIICSPEHTYDLVEDPLVVKYMQYTQTAQPYMDGQPVPLFNLKFEETMLDDYAYGYTEVSHPGEFEKIENNTLRHYLRLVLVEDATGNLYYINVPERTDFAASNNTQAASAVIDRIVEGDYIKDGSYIPELVKWDIAKWQAAATSVTVEVWTNGTKTTTTKNVSTGFTVFELPVHKSFMFGDEFMAKTGIDGRMNAKMYIKPLGSAGVLDPIDQRQSIGWKIDTLGFNTLRAEAMVQFVFVPAQALMTYGAVQESWAKRYTAKDPTTGKYPEGYNANRKYDTEAKREAAVNVKKDINTTYDESTVSTHVVEGFPHIEPQKEN